MPQCCCFWLPQVANYCVTKLAELNVPLSTHEVGLTPDTQLPPANTVLQYLELTCNGMVSGACCGGTQVCWLDMLPGLSNHVCVARQAVVLRDTQPAWAL